jgi:hypothetical protein
MRRFLLPLLGLLALAVPATGQQWDGRTWEQLTPEEQRRAWDNYQRWQQLNSQQQRMLEQRYRRFQALPPDQQQRMRQNYETYRGLDPGQRREFTEKDRRWKSGQR